MIRKRKGFVFSAFVEKSGTVVSLEALTEKLNFMLDIHSRVREMMMTEKV